MLDKAHIRAKFEELCAHRFGYPASYFEKQEDGVYYKNQDIARLWVMYDTGAHHNFWYDENVQKAVKGAAALDNYKVRAANIGYESINDLFRFAVEAKKNLEHLEAKNFYYYEKIKELDKFREAIIEELVVDCILTKDHETDPKKALHDAIQWNMTVALDPAVSTDAITLITSHIMRLSGSPVDVFWEEGKGFSIGWENDDSVWEYLGEYYPNILEALDAFEQVRAGSKW